MKTLTTLNQIITEANGRTLYIRWSRGPALDCKQGRSYDQVAGQYHNGLSAQAVRADDHKLLAQMLQEYQYLRRKDSKIYCWILAGTRNGTDSDGAPTIDPETITPIGRVSDDLIDRCVAYNTAYWQWQRKGWPAAQEPTVQALFDAIDQGRR